MNDDSISNVLKRNIRFYRVNADLSQEKLGILAGLNHTTVGYLERGKHDPSVCTLEKLAKVLGITEAALLDRSTTDEDIVEAEKKQKVTKRQSRRRRVSP